MPEQLDVAVAPTRANGRGRSSKSVGPTPMKTMVAATPKAVGNERWAITPPTTGPMSMANVDTMFSVAMSPEVDRSDRTMWT